MATTKVVNPKRRPRNADGTFKTKGRRKNPSRRKTRAYGSARRRRRNPEPAAAAPSSKRARVRSVYSYGGYRQQNPAGDMFDTDYLMDVTPAATLGNLAGRFAAKMAGPFEEVKTTVNGQPVTYLAPGLKHAIAIAIGAHVGGSLTESMLGPGKGALAKVSALGFGGSMFTIKRFMRDNQWLRDNVLLDGVDDCDDGVASDDMGAFEQRSAIGDDQPQIVQGSDGNFYVVPAGESVAGMGAFENKSSIGSGNFGNSGIRRDPAFVAGDSSFGYARAR